MVLDHVAQLAGLVEVAPAAFDTDLLGNGDLHVGDGILVPLGFEQAIGEPQGNQVLHRLLAQIVVDTVHPVFGEEPRHGIVDPSRRLQVVADGLLQHHPGTRGQPGVVEVFADGPVYRCRRGEVGDQRQVSRQLLRQGLVTLRLQEVQVLVAQPGQEAAQCSRLDIGLGHMPAQVGFDAVQVLLRAACLAGQRQQAGVRVQQVGPVELVERRKQLAQRQVAKGAKQGKRARIDTDRSHDVGSFLKLV